MTHYERIRAALYALGVALNTLALVLGWYSETQGAAILGVLNAALAVLAFVNVPGLTNHTGESDPQP